IATVCIDKLKPSRQPNGGSDGGATHCSRSRGPPEHGRPPGAAWHARLGENVARPDRHPRGALLPPPPNRTGPWSRRRPPHAAPSSPRRREPPLKAMIMKPGLRKGLLSAHLTVSVGWIGAVVAYL